jgi:hypothetical protein
MQEAFQEMNAKFQAAILRACGDKFGGKKIPPHVLVSPALFKPEQYMNLRLWI